MSPWHVDAEDPQAGALLEEVVRLVLAGGGHLAPGMVLVEEDGQLRVELRGDVSPGPLIDLPRALLVPVVPEPLGGPCAELRALLDALYAVTGRQLWFDTAHPRGALPEGSPLVAAIQQVRPHWRVGRGTEGLLATRAIRLAGAPGSDLRLMPLVDAMNHHSAAPRYTTSPEALSVAAWQAGGSPECFVRYRERPDPLAMALGYGFVDTTCRGAFSAPVVVEVAGLGVLEVAAGRLPEGRGPALPRVEAVDDGVRLSHLWLGPDTARAVVAMAVGARAARSGLGPAATRRAEEAAWSGLLDANAALLGHLAATADAHGGAAAAVVAAGAREQVRVLRRLG